MDEQIRTVMKHISGLRRRGVRQCVVCGADVPGALRTRRYCSQRCQKRVYRQTHARRAERPPAPGGGDE